MTLLCYTTVQQLLLV